MAGQVLRCLERSHGVNLVLVIYATDGGAGRTGLIADVAVAGAPADFQVLAACQRS